jgi:hypothetical protein
MSIEQARLVQLPPLDVVTALVRDIRSAEARATKALPGERTDIVRVESLSSQLERLAATYAAANPDDLMHVPCIDGDRPIYTDRDNLYLAPSQWRGEISRSVERGYTVVELRDPFGAGATQRPKHDPVPLPENAWPAPADGVSSKHAAAQRFRKQVAATLAPASDPPAFIEPSGVSNSILTNTLRWFVAMQGDRLDAPVRYQDGSHAQPFPLRCLQLADTVPPTERELRLAMLSIRHAEMDVEVDGCWFRNFNISRPRPAGETDQLAFETSKAQLTSVLAKGPLLIRLYQTGLETAVMGFYRAVVHQLLREPGSVAVVPMFFRHPPPLLDGAVRDPAVPIQHSYFAEGAPWATQ